MYAGQIISTVAMALCSLMHVQASGAIDKNQGSPVSGSIALQQTTALERKASQLLYSNGEYDEALTAYQEVLELKTRALGPDNVSLAPTLIDIALCYRARGDYTRAEDAYKRALDLKGRALGQTHKDVGKTLQRYACLMRLAGRKGEADDLDARATSILFGLHKGAQSPERS